MNGQLNCIDLKKSSKNSTCKAFYSVNAVKLLPLGFDKFKGKMLLRNTTKLLSFLDEGRFQIALVLQGRYTGG